MSITILLTVDSNFINSLETLLSSNLQIKVKYYLYILSNSLRIYISLFYIENLICFSYLAFIDVVISFIGYFYCCI